MNDDPTRDIADIKATLGRQDEKLKALTDRVDKQDRIIETVNQLAISVGRIADGQNTIKENVEALRIDIDDLKGKPAKRWDAIIAAAITGVVAYIIGRITKGA